MIFALSLLLALAACATSATPTSAATAVALKNGQICISWSVSPKLFTSVSIAMNSHAIWRTALLQGSIQVFGTLAQCTASDVVEESCFFRDWEVLVLPYIRKNGAGDHETKLRVRSRLISVELVRSVESCPSPDDAPPSCIPEDDYDEDCPSIVSSDATPLAPLPPPSGRVIQFEVSGGLVNKMYSLLGAVAVAARLNASLQLPSIANVRGAYDGGSVKGVIFKSLFDIFTESSLRAAAAVYSVPLLLPYSPSDPSTHFSPSIRVDGRMRMWGPRQAVAAAANLSSVDGVMHIGNSYQIMCPTLDEAYDKSSGSSCVGIWCHCHHLNFVHSDKKLAKKLKKNRAVLRKFLFSLQPPSPVPQLAEKILAALTDENRTFAALHLRLEDDWHLSKKDPHRHCFLDIPEIIGMIEAMPFHGELKLMPLYIMGGFALGDPRLEELGYLYNIVTKDDVMEVEENVDLDFDLHAFVDFMVGRSAKYVIGNQCSTFSNLIRLWRLDRGYPESSFVYYTGSTTSSCEFAWFGLPPYNPPEYQGGVQ